MLVAGEAQQSRRFMSEETFKSMVDKYYDRSIDNLRLKGHSRQKRPFISEKCGFLPDASSKAHKATLQRSRGQWPAPHMLDSSGATCLMDGKYGVQGTFQPPPGYVRAKESTSATFILHTSNIYTNVQVLQAYALNCCTCKASS